MSGPADELQQIAADVAALGEQIEVKRKRALELLEGRKLETRRGDRFIVDRVRANNGGGGWRLWAEGPRLKADGAPHARTRDMLII